MQIVAYAKEHPIRSAIIVVGGLLVVWWVFFRKAAAPADNGAGVLQAYGAAVANAQAGANQLAAIQTAAQAQVAQTQIATAAHSADLHDVLSTQLATLGLQHQQHVEDLSAASDFQNRYAGFVENDLMSNLVAHPENAAGILETGALYPKFNLLALSPAVGAVTH